MITATVVGVQQVGKYTPGEEPLVSIHVNPIGMEGEVSFLSSGDDDIQVGDIVKCSKDSVHVSRIVNGVIHHYAASKRSAITDESGQDVEKALFQAVAQRMPENFFMWVRMSLALLHTGKVSNEKFLSLLQQQFKEMDAVYRSGLPEAAEAGDKAVSSMVKEWKSQ